MSSPHSDSNSETGEGTRSTFAIRSDIERTRERLGESVEALGAQLNPSLLAQHVKDSVHDATIGRVQTMASNTKDRVVQNGRNFTQTIRDNPLPAAIAAASLGWLLLSRREQGPHSDRFHNGASDDDSLHSRGVREMASAVGEKAQQVGERVSDKAKELSSRVADTARSTGERISDSADTALSSVRSTTRRASASVGSKYDESPMMLGAVALALGVAVGASMPRTRREVEMVGNASDKLMDKARGQIASTTERVEGVIERALPEVKEVVRDAAREAGLGWRS